MFFNSLEFFIFLAVVFLVYFLVPKKVQWIILLLSSYFFYAYFSWKFLFFIVTTTVTTYLCARFFGKENKKQQDFLENNKDIDSEQKKKYKQKIKKNKKTLFVLTLLFNFGILVFLKYANFFIDNINSIIGWFGPRGNIASLHLLLPLGISFYTFQAMGYLIDCYWGKAEPQKNIFRFALFISYFPQIIEGPISRYNDLEPQLEEKHSFNYTEFTYGMQLVLWGLFKKMVIADALGLFVDTIFGNVAGANGLQAFVAVIFYAIQDYADFSGCMDIVLGISQCMGIKLMQNFKRPYFSRSIAEYWRRWHITLGSWFKDYLFYPFSISKGSIRLGKWSKKHFGNDFGKQVPAMLGLALCWLITGLWHGASWNYILWGVYYGILIMLSIILEKPFTKCKQKLKINESSFWWKAFQMIRTFSLLLVGRIIFRASSLADAWLLFKKTFTVLAFNSPFDSLFSYKFPGEVMACALLATVVLLVVDIIKERKPEEFSIRETIAKKKLGVRWLIWILLFVVVILFGIYGSSEGSSQFIYVQF